ncbi:MAG: DNA gyrase inhibitor YacG [Pseudomonadota bacterium]|jgi:endogenous inhibitor of DNA gyrase (YacG/DUF329 family)
MQQAKPPTVACPVCGKSAVFGAENPYRPFCSERCKLIDLGQWAEEGYRVPMKETPGDESESPPGNG